MVTAVPPLSSKQVPSSHHELSSRFRGRGDAGKSTVALQLAVATVGAERRLGSKTARDGLFISRPKRMSMAVRIRGYVAAMPEWRSAARKFCYGPANGHRGAEPFASQRSDLAEGDLAMVAIEIQP